MTSRIYLLLFSLCLSFFSFGLPQDPVLTSLEKRLHAASTDMHRLEAFLALAEYYDEKQPSAEALDTLEEALVLAEKLQDFYALGKLHRLYGQIYNENFQSQFEKITAHFEESLRWLEVAKSHGHPLLEVEKEMVRTLKSLALKQWQAGKLQQSLPYYDSAIRFSHRVWLKDSMDASITRTFGLLYNGCGAVHWGLGNYQQSLDHYLKALPLFEKIASPYHRSLIFSNIGLIYKSWEQKEEASRYFRKALSEALKAENLNARAYAYSNLAQMMEEAAQYDSALVYFEASAENYLKTNHLGGSGFNLNGMGAMYIKRGEPAKALEVFEQAYAIAKNRESIYFQCRSGANIALAQVELGRIGLSLEAGQTALAIAKREKYRELEKEIHHTLSRAYEAQGNLRQALSHFREHAALKDSLFTEEKFKLMSRMKEEFEVESTTRENELLRLEGVLQSQSLKRANIQRWGLVVLVTVVVVFLAIVWSSRQKLQIFSQRLSAQKEEISHQKEELAQQTDELRKSNEVKDLMLSILTHDLRSPLGNMEQLVNMLNNRIITEEEFRSLLPQVGDALGQVSTLTDNLLHWVNSRMGGLKIEKETFQLKALCMEKFGFLEKTASDKGIIIKNSISENLCAFADPYMIEVVLRNLLSNAVKFCQKGDEIRIEAEPKGDFLEIRVCDTGQGMDAGTLERLLSGEQFTTAGTKKERGSGLGLLITRQFVELNGGALHAHSQPREGSTFYFTLPIAI
jgi:two-component system, sensor histidine kinase and response regulator